MFTIHHTLSLTFNTNYSCLDVQQVMCTVLGKLDKYFESDPCLLYTSDAADDWLVV